MDTASLHGPPPAPAPIAPPSLRRRGGWLDPWEPEDHAFWAETGRVVARRNLVWSILAEHVGFSVWLVWSVAASELPAAGFSYSTEQLFSLISIPGLVGAFMRLPYTLAVARFGGRNWTIVSALLLLVPAIALGVLAGRPDTPFWLMALAAASAGVGGGNFASSMANISFFFPDREKGLALGLNAAGGNLGVSTVQLLAPLAIHAGGGGLGNAGWMWLPLIAVAAGGGALFMDNLSVARSDLPQQLRVARRPETWLVSTLYLGTFGSYVGYSAAFPLLLKLEFPAVGSGLLFAGPLLGAVARPLGGRLADRRGGAAMTLASFAVLGLATLAAMLALHLRSLGLFLAAFAVLFATAGVGNGSTFKMVPSLFGQLALREASAGAGAGDPEVLRAALAAGRRQAASALGISSAVGALGAFVIPRCLGASLRATGTAGSAFAAFLAFYLLAAATTWWRFIRRARPARPQVTDEVSVAAS